MTAPLTFGLGHVVPDGLAAWGARFIVDQNGHVDLPWDRTDLFIPLNADKAAFLAFLNQTLPMGTLHKIIRSKLEAREINTREQQVHTIFDDDGLVVMADTNASAGYLYVAAWRKPADTCAVCSEPIQFRTGWVHEHGDTTCGTGDGAVATPKEAT